MIYILELSYKGTNYHGWQKQKNAHTVQDELESAISTLLQLKIDTIGSGRTDAGVHALQQFVQFDTSAIKNPAKFIFQLNAILPHDIVVNHIYSAGDTFNVRFDAIERSYEYRITFAKNPFLSNECCFYFRPQPDIQLMNTAASILYQHTDFQSFSKYKTEVNHFNCTVSQAFWAIENDLLVFHISANRFLRGMVRAIVGTLLEVGQKKITLHDFEEIIRQKDRVFAKESVSPDGLFLTKVKYPESMIALLA